MTDDRTLAERVEVLEELVERQQRRIATHRERIDELEAERETAAGTGAGISRRSALRAGGLVGLLALGAGTASADPRGQVGTAEDPVATPYAEALDGAITTDHLASALGTARRHRNRPPAVASWLAVGTHTFPYRCIR